MIYFKILIDLFCGCLFSWGGFNNHNMRRFVMPLSLSLSCCFITHSLWPLLMLVSIGFLCMGYGDKSPLRHIFGDGWGRFVWGALVALGFSVPLCLKGFVNPFFVLPYVVLCATLENSLKNIQQVLGDLLIGIAIGSIIFLVAPVH